MQLIAAGLSGVKLNYNFAGHEEESQEITQLVNNKNSLSISSVFRFLKEYFRNLNINISIFDYINAQREETASFRPIWP